LARDQRLYNLFRLCDEKKRFVFEVSPDIFGDELTPAEVDYWTVFNIIKSAMTLNIDIKGLSFFDAIEEIHEEILKRKREVANARRK